MSIADELERLRRLHAEGELTDEEYARAKARVIDGERKDAGPALRRSARGAWLAGVCVGLSNWSGVPLPAVRLGFCLLAPFAGVTVLIYTLMAFAIPTES